MPYIVVNLQGQGTAGGFLKIDGERAIALSDDLIIQLPVGHHYLSFSSQSPSARGMANLNAAVGNYKTAAWAERNSVDGEISEYFSETSVMQFTVISDSRGHILDLPKYVVKELTEEEYDELTQIYEERIALQEEQRQADSPKLVTELLLCIFLGGFGVHKFYRKKSVWVCFTCLPERYLVSAGLWISSN